MNLKRCKRRTRITITNVGAVAEPKAAPLLCYLYRNAATNIRVTTVF